MRVGPSRRDQCPRKTDPTELPALPLGDDTTHRPRPSGKPSPSHAGTLIVHHHLRSSGQSVSAVYNHRVCVPLFQDEDSTKQYSDSREQP